jgi:hypothetical protein
MITRHHFAIGTSCLATLFAGCVDEQPEPNDNVAELDGELADEDAPLGVALAPCISPTIPAPYDRTVDFDTLSSAGRLYLMDDYGTSSCSSDTTRMLSTAGHWSLAPAISTPTTANDCVYTKLTVLEDTRTVHGSWSRETHTEYGTWTASGCILPTLEGFFDYYTPEVRLTGKLEQRKCAGSLCGTVYGRPFFIVATPN